MTKTADSQTTALLTLLERLAVLHDQLRDVICEKVERMRTADIEGMRSCIDREAALVEQVTEQEGLRRQIMIAVGQSLGISPSRARSMNIRVLANRLAEPGGTRLLAAADRLRRVVAQVAERNRVAGLIAREILGHFRHVFAAMTTTGGARVGGYTHQGGLDVPTRRRLLDALG